MNVQVGLQANNGVLTGARTWRHNRDVTLHVMGRSD